jgi:aminomethyltransferase
MSDGLSLRRTALHHAHVAANARLVPFAGYEMPVQYTGIIAESKAVRESAGMFDVSHMARLTLTGEGVEEFLEVVTTNDVARLPVNGGQYSLLPNDEGGCVDDIIVYRLDECFSMVVNASNHAKDAAWLEQHRPEGVRIADETQDTAMLAVQGPRATEILSRLCSLGDALFAAAPFGVVHATFAGLEARAARSGYTGEDGFELICQAKDAEALWDALLDAGVVPCGLGSRDTLRVEAGLPLYGHELADDLSPIAAGLGWVVSKTKSFIGGEPINLARKDGTPTKLVGVRLNAKRLMTRWTSVLVDGRRVGEVSSGVISPTLDTAIALAFVESETPIGAECTVETKGKPENGQISSKRFYRREGMSGARRHA